MTDMCPTKTPCVRKTCCQGRERPGDRTDRSRNRHESRLTAWWTEQPGHLNSKVTPCSFPPSPGRGQWSPLPWVSWVFPTLVRCQQPVRGALPLGSCLWDLLLGWGHLWEATSQWCCGLQWWDLPIPWWYPLGRQWLDQTAWQGRLTSPSCQRRQASVMDQKNKSNFYLYCKVWK